MYYSVKIVILSDKNIKFPLSFITILKYQIKF